MSANDPAPLLVGRGEEQVVEVVEVHVDRPERDAGPLGDPAGGRAQVAFGDEPEQGPHHGVAGAGRPRRPSVEGRLPSRVRGVHGLTLRFIHTLCNGRA